jgi:lysophospholipase L1-like esterase
MALRKPALVVVQYGTNESDLWKIDWDEYEKNLGEVLDMIKAAASGASVLVMAPMDRAERGAGGVLQTKPVVLKLREVQHRVALAKGLAFWDTFTAMGGEGSMAKWVKSEPQLGGGDLTHPTPAGAEVLGNLFAKALITGYDAHASQHP